MEIKFKVFPEGKATAQDFVEANRIASQLKKLGFNKVRIDKETDRRRKTGGIRSFQYK